MYNINNMIILIICDRENLISAFVGLLHKFKYNLTLMVVYRILILLIPNRQNYFICTGIKKLIICNNLYFNNTNLFYYINLNIPLTHEYGKFYVNVYSVSLTGCTCECLHKLLKLRIISTQNNYIFATKQHMKDK